MADNATARQNSYPDYAEQQTSEPRMNRRGELVTMPAYHQLIQDGRVFAINSGT